MEGIEPGPRGARGRGRRAAQAARCTGKKLARSARAPRGRADAERPQSFLDTRGPPTRGREGARRRWWCGGIQSRGRAGRRSRGPVVVAVLVAMPDRNGPPRRWWWWRWWSSGDHSAEPTRTRGPPLHAVCSILGLRGARLKACRALMSGCDGRVSRQRARSIYLWGIFEPERGLPSAGPPRGGATAARAVPTPGNAARSAAAQRQCRGGRRRRRSRRRSPQRDAPGAQGSGPMDRARRGWWWWRLRASGPARRDASARRFLPVPAPKSADRSGRCFGAGTGSD